MNVFQTNLIKKLIIKYAINEIGFDDCRFTSPHLDKELDEYRQLVNSEKIGDMHYLAKHLPFKERPEKLLPKIQSAIVLLKNYKNTTRQYLDQKYKIARFAVGKDYHYTFQENMAKLETYIKRICPETDCYAGCDSRPIAERALAVKSGIGYQGLNHMVYHPKYGSYVIIGVIFITTRFPDDPPIINSCDKCQKCVEACPTKALKADGSMEITKCISYQTIEAKKEVNFKDIETFQGWTFGCDACQEVCHLNTLDFPLSNWEEFFPGQGVGFDFFDQALAEDALQIPKHSPLYRSRNKLYTLWRSRNAK